MSYVYTGTELAPNDEYLAHYGILRQEWGVRRFQNYDGTLTPAGRERYHKMIATNVNRDKMRRYTDAPGGIGDWYHNRNRRKVQKEIQKEFEATSEGKRLAEANKKLSKIQGRMNNRDDAYKDPENGALAKTVNRIGQNADKNRMAGALAEQNEAQKAAAKIYDELREKHKEEILDATIKDLKIYIVDDGREWLEKYIRGDDDATFSKVSRKQARAEAKEAAADRKAGKEKAEYIDKVETKNGDTRYFYDKSELKAYKDGKSGATDKDLDDAYKKMRNSSKTDEEKDLKEHYWNNAKDNDRWDINFLEAVQNSAILERNDKKSLLTEYAKYLADPSDYWENGKDKLREL